ncbi:MAG: GH3 auxin-responsive promoter family protein [Saprospiraceae bacterium]
MFFFGQLIKTGISLSVKSAKDRPNPINLQFKTLRKLLRTAKDTEFGKEYEFKKILKEEDELIQQFQKMVPISDYNSIYKNWWYKSKQDKENICWPDRVPYFALSSGTSEAASKYIPITKSFIKSARKVSRRMFRDIVSFDLPSELFNKEMLLVGSSTHLIEEGMHYVGDLSGILSLNRPIWLKPYYRPGFEISNLQDWNKRIELIVENAPSWDISFVIGNVAWVQLIFEKIIEHYKLKTIHDLWPNFSLIALGGIFFEPYRNSFEMLLSKPIIYINSYMASEGFFAYQPDQNINQMEFIANAGIFYEFIEFNDNNFDSEGNIKPNSQAITMANVKLNIEYALVISTNAGSWRYLIGDTLKFENLMNFGFNLTGRTKQYLSVVGEHISIDNLNQAILHINKTFNLNIKEFSLMAVNYETHWAHQYYISCADNTFNKLKLAKELDEYLQSINDDYRCQRKHQLKKVMIEIIPVELFYEWLELNGKLNGQAKIPRIMKSNMQTHWESFISTKLNVNETYETINSSLPGPVEI